MAVDYLLAKLTLLKKPANWTHLAPNPDRHQTPVAMLSEDDAAN